MAITPRTATQQGLNSVNTFSVTKPTGTADGDIIVIAIVLGNVTVTSAPSGFTLLTNSPQVFGVSSLHSYVYYKVASGEPASWSVTLSGFAIGAVVCEAWSGNSLAVDQQNSGSAGTAGSANVVVPSYTSTKAGQLIAIAAFLSSTSPGSSTPPSGYTEEADQVASFDAKVITIADIAQGAAGATGTATFVSNGALGSNGDAAYSYLNIYEPAISNIPGPPPLYAPLPRLGPPAQWSNRRPTPIQDITVAPATDTNFGPIRVNTPSMFVGPYPLRVFQHARTALLPDLAGVTDTNPGPLITRPPSPIVGPPAWHQYWRPIPLQDTTNYIADTNPGQLITRPPSPFVGSMAWRQYWRPTPIQDVTLAALTDTNPGQLITRPPTPQSGPPAWRIAWRPIPIQDSTVAPVSDTNPGPIITRPPSPNVGPIAWRQLWRPSPPPNPTVAPVTDTNFGTPMMLSPSGLVGPYPLRQLWRRPPPIVTPPPVVLVIPIPSGSLILTGYPPTIQIIPYVKNVPPAGSARADVFPMPAGSASVDTNPPTTGTGSADTLPPANGRASADSAPPPAGWITIDITPPQGGNASMS